MEELEKITEVAVRAAKEAGEYAMAHIGKIKEISRKEGLNNLVTDVDKKCEEIIIGHINKEFPSHSILAEESGDYQRDDRVKWVIDPLDGTTNYAHGLPSFCESIGIIIDGSIKTGVVYDPARDELFTAKEGEGSFLNGNRIRVSDRDSIAESMVATGFAYSMDGKIANMDYFSKMIQDAQAVRRVGSAAIDLCYVACGRFDGFWELGLYPWDTAAGQLIVEEAGGTVTTLDRGPYDIFKKEILATNGRIHDEMINVLTGK